MTLQEFNENYHNLNERAVHVKWQKIFDYLLTQKVGNIHCHDALLEILHLLIEYEGDDCWGTEGMNI